MATIPDAGIEIANAISKMHRESYGRGPRSARTVMGRDHVVVFLDDIYTTVERTLIDDGKFGTVRSTRRAFQMTLRGAFVEAVETATGRRVRAFMSDVHEDPGVAAEVFVLERGEGSARPVGSPGFRLRNGDEGVSPPGDGVQGSHAPMTSRLATPLPKETPVTEPNDVGIAIANEITRLHRQHYGRGAASARTIMGRDHVVVFLEDIYTTVERTLIEAGEFATVHETRHRFQMIMRESFSEVVEKLLGRRVVAFMSETHEDPGIAAEIFVLEREG
jgi:uncharacterized protein YbcI